MKRVIANDLLLPEVSRRIAEGQSVRIRVKGSSMIPFLHENRDEVVLSPFQRPDLKAGVIVLAFLPRHKKYVLHRILQKSGNLLELMGDGNLYGTEICHEEDVIAIVRTAIRNNMEVDFTEAYWLRRAGWWRRLLPVRRYLLWIYKGLVESGYIFNGIKQKLNRA
ncbi:MAG: S24/S26 family peptidase [Bacteroidales bacterium]